MAKQRMGWVYSPKATAAQKVKITSDFEPLIQALKKKLTPIPEPQRGNHCIDVFSKCRGNYFYIMQKYKTGEGGIKPFFDIGLARLEFMAWTVLTSLISDILVSGNHFLCMKKFLPKR